MKGTVAQFWRDRAGKLYGTLRPKARWERRCSTPRVLALRRGADLCLKSPAGATPEDPLVVQFQGMIAEYERAQIAARCRDQKRSRMQT